MAPASNQGFPDDPPPIRQQRNIAFFGDGPRHFRNSGIGGAVHIVDGI
ncbi:hypothetical protein [Mycobacterium canetti]|nr:hypothetical protein [Mycobacterium canetti]